jgi:hypothetical protein
MGANAGTAVPTYASGEVLTAANLNLTNSGTPVFADSSARDGAFGSGKKVLAEGQLCYLEDLDVVQYYDSSSWQTLGPAAAGALTFISATTIGTTVSSVTVTGAFSSTYANYLILLDGGVASTNIEIQLQLGATTANYSHSYIYMTTDSNTITGASNDAAANFPVAGYGSVNTLNARINLFGPNQAKHTPMHFQAMRSATGGRNAVGQGVLRDTTQYTAFTLLASTGTMTGGVIRVYGYANS